MKIFGQVSVAAAGNCALSLKVNSLGIAGPDGKVLFLVGFKHCYSTVRKEKHVFKVTECRGTPFSKL